MATQPATGWTCCASPNGNACKHWNNDAMASVPPRCGSCGHEQCPRCSKKQPKPTVTGLYNDAAAHGSLSIQRASYPIPLSGNEGLTERYITDEACDDDAVDDIDDHIEDAIDGNLYDDYDYEVDDQMGNHSIPGSQFSSQNRRNWWRCGNCQNVNNPELAPDACSICGHRKCGCCGKA